MADKVMSLQDQFLNAVRKSKAPVTIFLMKGVKLHGVITWFDSFSLLLRREGVSQLLYKHAISTILPTATPDNLASPAPVAGKKQTLQDIFLTAARRDGAPMTVFLVNGVMLQGSVEAFDQFSLLLGRAGQSQLVYKHAVSTLQPAHPLDLESEGDADEGADA